MIVRAIPVDDGKGYCTGKVTVVDPSSATVTIKWLYGERASDAPTRNGPVAPNFRVGGNTIMSPEPVMVGQTQNMSLRTWQTLGHDPGTREAALPTDEELQSLIRDRLWPTWPAEHPS